MDQRTDQIVGTILEERERLGDNIAQLERKMREATTWETYFMRKPWLMLGIALGGGFLLSSLFTSRSR